MVLRRSTCGAHCGAWPPVQLVQLLPMVDPISRAFGGSKSSLGLEPAHVGYFNCPVRRAARAAPKQVLALRPSWPRAGLVGLLIASNHLVAQGRRRSRLMVGVVAQIGFRDQHPGCEREGEELWPGGARLWLRLGVTFQGAAVSGAAGAAECAPQAPKAMPPPPPDPPITLQALEARVSNMFLGDGELPICGQGVAGAGESPP